MTKVLGPSLLEIRQRRDAWRSNISISIPTRQFLALLMAATACENLDRLDDAVRYFDRIDDDNNPPVKAQDIGPAVLGLGQESRPVVGEIDQRDVGDLLQVVDDPLDVGVGEVAEIAGGQDADPGVKDLQGLGPGRPPGP